MPECYRINSDDVTYRIIDNEVVILSLKTGAYYSLNKTGTFIWRLLEDSISRDGLVDKVTQEFGIGRKIAIRDVKLLLKDLVSEQMVGRQEEV